MKIVRKLIILFKFIIKEKEIAQDEVLKEDNDTGYPKFEGNSNINLFSEGCPTVFFRAN